MAAIALWAVVRVPVGPGERPAMGHARRESLEARLG